MGLRTRSNHQHPAGGRLQRRNYAKDGEIIIFDGVAFNRHLVETYVPILRGERLPRL